MVWAKPRALPKARVGRRPVGLEPRAVPGVWVGIYEPTGENIVITMDGQRPAFRVRTVARRPVQERWSSAAIQCIIATPRVPDPRAPGRTEIATPKQAKVFQSDGDRGDEAEYSDDSEGEDAEEHLDGPDGV